MGKQEHDMMEYSGSRDEDKQSPLSQPQQPHRKEKEPDKGPDHLRTDILTVGKHMRRWKIVRKIGSGGFGQIYQGLDLATNKDVAIKVESKQCPNQLLKMEVTVLNAVQGKDHICQYVACGKTKTFSFLVMSLQGKNLGELRREVPSGTLTIETILRITRQIILSIKTVHKAGFLHRDIKPSNFTIGNTPETKKTVYILDFGLARPYTNGKGEVRKARSNAGFRGTARYASINAHHSKELSRRDDLWSMFYMIVEFRLGTLPWKKIKNKEEIVTVKENCDPNDFFRFLPREFEQIYNHIKSLQYEDEPDYDLLISLIDQSIKRKNVDLNAPFDWERINDTPTTRRKRAAKNHSADSTPCCSAVDARHSVVQDDLGNGKHNENFINKQSPAPKLHCSKTDEENINVEAKAESCKSINKKAQHSGNKVPIIAIFLRKMQEANQEHKSENHELCQASKSTISLPNHAKSLDIQESKSERIHTNDKGCNSDNNPLIPSPKEGDQSKNDNQAIFKGTDNSANDNGRASLNNGLAIQINSEELDLNKSLGIGNSSKTAPASALPSSTDHKDESWISRNIDLDDDRFQNTKQIEPIHSNFLSPDVSNDVRCSRSYSQNDILSDRITSTRDDDSIRSLNFGVNDGVLLDKVKRKPVLRASSFNIKPPPGRAEHNVVGARRRRYKSMTTSPASSSSS